MGLQDISFVVVLLVPVARVIVGGGNGGLDGPGVFLSENTYTFFALCIQLWAKGPFLH